MIKIIDIQRIKMVDIRTLAIVLFILIPINTMAQIDNSSISPKSASPYHRTMEATKTDTPPKLDGILDDPAWSITEFQTDFMQREPIEGDPATEKTEAAIIYDANNLYIGIRLFHKDPTIIRGQNMQRDGTIGDGDYFGTIIDTFNDGQNAFYFITNPLGLRLDGTISADGNINNVNWDGVWRCKTSRDDLGWYIELEIPWQTLRFKEGDNITMGIQFSRRINQKNEDNTWRFVPRYAGRLGQYRISEAGEITGFNGLKMGGNTEIKPYLSGGVQRDDNDNKNIGDAGIDIKRSITSTLTADMTYNTDFAQVEADQERVNLTRFDLFFPEKREFFLEGSETFFFGQAGRSMTSNGRNPTGNIRLFHSRRIGIHDRNKIPILGGIRLNGKAGKKTSIGLLSIQTDQATTTDEELVPGTNFSALRIKRNIFAQSTAGIMVLNKQQKGGDYNRSIGFDSSFDISKKLSFYVIGAGTYSTNNEAGQNKNRNNIAGNIGGNWQSDLWQYTVSYLDIEKMFNPEMGYIRRTDIQRTSSSITYSPRPGKRFPKIRKFLFTAQGNYQTDHNSFILNKDIEGAFSLLLNGSTASVGFNLKREYEYLEFDWDIREYLEIPESGYSSTTGNINFNTGRAHALQLSGNIGGGDFFGGKSKTARLGVNLVVPQLRIQNSYSFSDINLPAGSFHTNRLSTRILYTFTPDLFIKGYFQWIDDKLLLNRQDRLSANILFRWTFKPMSDIYLVYNQENLVGPGSDSIANRTLLAKFTYFVRK